MGALVALAGWPAAEPPEGAWRTTLGDDLPVAIATLGGVGPSVSSATNADARVHVWVRRRAWEDGLDPVLEQAVRAWVDEAWPFETVSYPGR